MRAIEIRKSDRYRWTDDRTVKTLAKIADDAMRNVGLFHPPSHKMSTCHR